MHTVEKEGTLPLVATWVSQARQTNTAWYQLSVESEDIRLKETGSRLVVAGAGGGGNGEVLLEGYRLSVIR